MERSGEEKDRHRVKNLTSDQPKNRTFLTGPPSDVMERERFDRVAADFQQWMHKTQTCFVLRKKC